jgi:hypothetical protein
MGNDLPEDDPKNLANPANGAIGNDIGKDSTEDTGIAREDAPGSDEEYRRAVDCGCHRGFGMQFTGAALRMVICVREFWSLIGQYFLNRGTWPATLPGDAALGSGLESYRWEVERRRCVKKTRKRHAVRKMKVGPSESPVGGGFKLPGSCFDQKPRW